MIYLDHSATTPLCPAARTRMLAVMDETFGNPSSKHTAGLDAKAMVNDARKAILAALQLPFITPETAPYQLFFTSGGTEANNLAVLGVATAKQYRGRPRIILGDGEHPSVTQPVEKMEAAGFDVVRIPTKGGAIDMEALTKALTPETILLSLMTVNNETGALYDVAPAFALAKRMCPAVVTHTDAVQAFGKLPLSPKSMNADLVTVSAHKIGGPKGMGALIVAKPVIVAKRIMPILYGGGQESGYRSGTENTVGIAGFYGAAEALDQKAFAAAASQRRQYILDRLPDGVSPNLPEKAAPHILSLSLEGLKSETILHFLSAAGIYVSAGSACSSNTKHTVKSPALRAFGLSDNRIDSTVRISLCGHETDEELNALLTALDMAVKTLIRK